MSEFYIFMETVLTFFLCASFCCYLCYMPSLICDERKWMRIMQMFLLFFFVSIADRTIDTFKCILEFDFSFCSLNFDQWQFSQDFSIDFSIELECVWIYCLGERFGYASPISYWLIMDECVLKCFLRPWYLSIWVKLFQQSINCIKLQNRIDSGDSRGHERLFE